MVPVQKTTNHPVQRLQRTPTSFPRNHLVTFHLDIKNINEELIKKPGGDWLRG